MNKKNHFINGTHDASVIFLKQFVYKLNWEKIYKS